jgi:2-isopropylmalate synthase
VHPRHPYVGELVFTAFSGSHQDAIKKSWVHQQPDRPWDTLYIPIDPADIGRTYRAIIRINSQSGKGGVAYVLEKEYGLQLPKAMHREIGKLVNDYADAKGTEIAADEIHALFQTEYINRTTPYALADFSAHPHAGHPQETECVADLVINGQPRRLRGIGNGPIAAFVHALEVAALKNFQLVSYNEHSLGEGADSKAAAYIQIKTDHGLSLYGAGIDTNIETASIRALLSAMNRAAKAG